MMKRIAVKCFVAVIRVIYSFIKLFPTTDRITLISRQSDTVTLDFELLSHELKNFEDIDVVILTKKIKSGLLGYIKYAAHMIRQMYHIARSKVVVLDSYCIAVSVLNHKKNLKVIQMWHALSAIKKFGYQTIEKADGSSSLIAKEMKMHRNYDFVLCSSNITAKHFCQAFDVSIDKILKIGLPRIDYILKVEEKREDVLSKYPELKEKKNILYVPTFRKGRPVDTKNLIDAIDFEQYNLIIKLHPLDKKSIVYNNVKGVIYDNVFNSYDMLSVADIIVSDYSSYVIESSLAEKPIYLYVYDYEEYNLKNGTNVDYNYESIGKYLFKDVSDMCRSFNEHYEINAVKELRERYVDINTKECSKQLSDFILGIVRNEN